MSTWMTLLLPLLSSISIAAYMVTYRHTLTTVLAIVIVVLSVVLVVGARQQARAHQQRTLDKHRGRYLEHLAEVKEAGREVAAMQREVSLWQHPGPERLWAIAARRRRVWERRPGDPDFLRLRLGTGRGALVTPLQMSARTDPTVEYEPTSMAAAERVRSALGTVAHQPAAGRRGPGRGGEHSRPRGPGPGRRPRPRHPARRTARPRGRDARRLHIGPERAVGLDRVAAPHP